MRPFRYIFAVFMVAGVAQAADPWRAFWIWDNPRANVDEQPQGDRFFRKTLEIPETANQAHTVVVADNHFKLWVNGQQVAQGDDWHRPIDVDISSQLQAGKNVIAIQVTNDGEAAGLLYESNVKTKKGRLIHIVTDDSWRTEEKAPENWFAVDYDDGDWKPVVVLGDVGTPPWGNFEKPADLSEQRPAAKPLPVAESLKRFTLAEGFEIKCIAAEPDIINPVVMALDERGRLFVTEAHTYRGGNETPPVNPPTNPVVMFEMGEDGMAHRKVVVDQGFDDPVMGLTVRDGKIWMAVLNELYVADLKPDGTAGPRKKIMHDVAKPSNPFGMFRVRFGPDGWMYMCVGDHDVEMIGSDGTRIRTRGSTGALFRFRPDGTGLQLLTQGCRVPYTFDFDPFGHTWVVSNGEGNPNRLLLMIPTVDYHFQTRHGDWNWLAGLHPWSPPVTEMERGANTQVLCYLDDAYPQEYWGSLFVSNWGAHGFASVNHKIDLYVPNARGEIEEVSVFLNCTDPMFRPTQLMTDRDGQLFMLDWYGLDDENDLNGRIYKIVYTGAKANQRKKVDLKNLENLPALTKLLTGGSIDREEASVYLGSLRNDAVIKAIAQLLKPDEDAFQSSQLIGVLRRMETPGAIDLIAASLKSKHASIRAMCVRLLRDLAVPDLAARVAVVGKDSDPEVRVEFALCQKESKAVIEALHAALAAGANQDRRLRYQCAVELSRRISAEDFIALANSKNEFEQLVAWIAMDVGLLEKTNPAAREALDALLTSADKRRVSEVLTLCERWATVETVPALQSLLQHELDSGGSIEIIRATLEILQRLGPEAVSNLSFEVVQAFFEKMMSGQVALSGPSEKISGLHMAEVVDAGEAGVKFIENCLQDVSIEVRLEAFKTIRLIGWQYPKLFARVWDLLAPGAKEHKLSHEEQLVAIAALGAEESPAAKKWRALLASSDPVVVRQALRTCKQFSDKPQMRELIRSIAPALLAERPDLKTEIAPLLGLYGLEEAVPDRDAWPKPIAERDSDELLRELLSRVSTSRPRLGQDVYERLGCAACHDIVGRMELFGPSLRKIGRATTPTLIAEAILFPSRVIKDGYDNHIVRLKDGRELEGWIEQHGDEYTIVHGNSERVRFNADELIERKKLDKSPMPDVSLDGVSVDELADLLAYLVSQGGNPKTVEAGSASK